MALAAEPAMTGKLPGDSGGRGDYLPPKSRTIHTETGFSLVLASQALDPTP